MKFDVRDMGDPAVKGGYDLITIFEAIHDMSRPVEVLARAKELLRDGGTMMVAVENVGESFAEPGPVDGFFYGASVLYLPAAGPCGATVCRHRHRDPSFDYASAGSRRWFLTR